MRRCVHVRRIFILRLLKIERLSVQFNDGLNAILILSLFW